MAKYHFEIVDGYIIEDPKGIELQSDRQARKVAGEIAKQVAADETDMKDVVVKNSMGDVIHTSPIKSDSDS
jgi:uncharacterized protein DUF6894